MIKNVVCVGVFFCARRELHKGMKKACFEADFKRNKILKVHRKNRKRREDVLSLFTVKGNVKNGSNKFHLAVTWDIFQKNRQMAKNRVSKGSTRNTIRRMLSPLTLIKSAGAWFHTRCITLSISRVLPPNLRV